MNAGTEGDRMAKKSVYVESSVISYLTARPANDILKLAKQRQTQMWWDLRDRWELFVSPLVMLEIGQGNPDAAHKRVEIADLLPQFPYTPEARRLADHLVAAGVIPKSSPEDAQHIAIAAVCGADYLVTWNQAHIFNADTIEKLYSVIRGAGYKPSVLVRPDSLLEKNDGA
jgi:hypothetical protein